MVIKPKPVNDDRSIIERTFRDQPKDFSGTLFIDALGEMDYKWLVRRSFLLLSSNFTIHCDGMRPAKIVQNTNHKSLVEDFCNIWVMVGHRGNTGKKVSNSAPPQTSVFGDRAVFSDGRVFRKVDILSPLREVAVSALPEPR